MRSTALRWAWSGAVVALVLAPGLVRAQPRLEAWLESDRVALGRTVDLIVEVEGGVGSLPDPRLPALPGLSVVGRSKSTSLSVGRNGVQRKAVHRYTLLPTRPGSVRIPPVRIRSGGRTVASQPLRLVVSDRGGRPLRDPDREAASTPPVFAVTRLDRDRSWVGEQVVLTFAFYHDPDVPLASSPDYDPPETPGFWRVEIDDEPRVSREPIGERVYHVQRFRYALFPLRPGELTVGPARVRVVRPDRNEWWRPGRARTLTTDPIRLQVDSLPAGAPPGFDGAIGRYELAGGLRDTTAREGTPFELEVVVSGRGNPTVIAAPVLPSWPDVTVHPPTVESDVGGDDEQITGSKTFRYVLVPRTEGRLDLGTARLPYFDPSRDAYVVDTLRLGEVTVAGGLPGTTASRPRGEAGPTLWPPRTPVARERTTPTDRGWFWGGLAAPWLVGLALVGWTRRRRRVAGARWPDARRRFTEARRAVEAGEPGASERALRAIDDILEAGWGVRLASATPHERARILEDAGVPAGVRSAVRMARDELAASSYGGELRTGGTPALSRLAALLPTRREGVGGPVAGIGALLVLAAASAPVAATSPSADPAEAWARANRAYRSGDFALAIDEYRTLLADHADPRLEANLAASLWRADRRGDAVVRYRRAIALAPRSEAIRRDLGALERELDDPPRVSGPGEAVLGRVRRSEIAWVLLFVNAFAASLVTSAAWTNRHRMAALLGVGAVAGLALTLSLHEAIVRPEGRAVARVDAPIASRPGGPVIARLPEGSVVEVLERGPTAWRIRTPSRPAGWVAVDRIAPLDFDVPPGAER